MHVYSGGHDVQCMQAQRTNPMGHRGSIYRDKMYVQRTNHNRHVVVNILFYSLHMDQNNGIKCTYKGPMGSQCMYNYRDTRYLCVQRTNPMGN